MSPGLMRAWEPVTLTAFFFAFAPKSAASMAAFSGCCCSALTWRAWCLFGSKRAAGACPNLASPETAPLLAAHRLCTVGASWSALVDSRQSCP